jgi:TonB family protein
MSPTTDNKALTPLQHKLAEAQAKTDGGNFKGALATLREAKSLEPRNIYILAFEKQVEQLAELSDMHLLSDDQRADIMESIPGIIERAMEGSRTSADAAPVRDTRAELNKEREERVAALEWLKNQYFQHAHDYVRKGEYEHALAEIRRVYIIDPNNQIARDFEKQIDQLIALRQTQATPRTQTAPSAYPGSSGQRPAIASAPGIPAGAEQPRLHGSLATDAEPKVKKPVNITLVIAVILTLVAIAIASYYFVVRHKQLKPPPPTEQSVSELLGSQGTETAEQTFLISQTEGSGTVQTQATPERTLGGTAARATDFSPPPEALAAQSVEYDGVAEAGVPDATGKPGPSRESASGQESPSIPIGASDRNTESVTDDAKIVHLERPKLPEGIYASGLEGQVVVQVDLDRDGNPKQARILRSTNDLLNHVVIDAVNRSQFSPRKMTNGPVNSSITIPFTFRSKR